MLRIRRMICATSLIIILMLALSPHAKAQQRMAIAVESVEIAANETSQVATYCLDFTRSSPTATDSYSHVLTGSESATVHFANGQSLPLQEALQQGLVAMQGRHMSFADFLQSANDPAVQARVHLTPQEKAQFALLQSAWNGATPSEKAQIEKGFEGATPEFWDHTHLQIVNKTRQSIKISFDEATVLGTKDESLQGTAFSTMKGPLGGGADLKVQQKYWEIGDRSQQSALAYLGYYNGRVDGLSGPQTKAAIGHFQSDFHLPITQEFDSATTTALHDAADARKLVSVNGKQQGLSLITITNTPSNPAGRYSLFTGGDTPALVTSDPQKLSQAINSFTGSAQHQSFYIDLDGFSEDKAKALLSNLRREQRAADPSVIVDGVPRSLDAPDLQSILFSPGAQVESTEAKVETVSDGPFRGFFRATIDFVVKLGTTVKNISVSFISRTQSYAQELAELVLGYSSQAADRQLSTAQIVAFAERDFRVRHPNISDDDYVKEVNTQLGTIDIAESNVAVVGRT